MRFDAANRYAVQCRRPALSVSTKRAIYLSGLSPKYQKFVAKVRTDDAAKAIRRSTAEDGEDPEIPVETLELLYADCTNFMQINAAAVGDRSTRPHVLMAEAQQEAEFQQAALDAVMTLHRLGYTRTTPTSEPSVSSEPYDTSVFAAMRAGAAGGGAGTGGTSGGAPAGPAKKTRAPKNKPRKCSNCSELGHPYYECTKPKTQETKDKIASYEKYKASQGNPSAAQLEREVADMAAAMALKKAQLVKVLGPNAANRFLLYPRVCAAPASRGVYVYVCV